jgi:DNA invertase Pin-like site-specific DNA recombinase
VRAGELSTRPFCAIRWAYADGGFSSGNMERPALQGLVADIRAGRIDIVVIYKVGLTQSLANFARLVEIFDAHDAAFVPVTQQLNTTSEMGHLTLNESHSIDFIEVIFHPTRRRRPIASLDGSRVE